MSYVVEIVLALIVAIISSKWPNWADRVLFSPWRNISQNRRDKRLKKINNPNYSDKQRRQRDTAVILGLFYMVGFMLSGTLRTMAVEAGHHGDVVGNTVAQYLFALMAIFMFVAALYNNSQTDPDLVQSERDRLTRSSSVHFDGAGK